MNDAETTPSPRVSDPPPAQPAAPRRWRKPQPHHKKRDRKGALLVLPSARLAEGRRLREFRNGLIEHIGGRPTLVELTLIDRATVLQHHLSTLDRKAAENDEILSLHRGREYLAWSNNLTRTLARLGLQAAPPRAPTLAEILAADDDEQEATRD